MVWHGAGNKTKMYNIPRAESPVICSVGCNENAFESDVLRTKVLVIGKENEVDNCKLVYKLWYSKYLCTLWEIKECLCEMGAWVDKMYRKSCLKCTEIYVCTLSAAGNECLLWEPYLKAHFCPIYYVEVQYSM